MKLTTAIVVIGLTGCGSRSSSPHKAVPTMYILDSGQTGWVKIVYNRPDEAELPVRNGFAVARIGQDLKLFTRSPMNPSWDGSQFYYRAADGKSVRLSSADGDSRLVWGQEKTTGADGDREDFFVGDQQQLSQSLHATFTGGLLGPLKDSESPEKPKQPSDASEVLTDLSK